MARPRVQIQWRKLCCSVCLDLLKVPVTIPCGHSYCMSCITRCWDEEDREDVSSCPQCRKNFETRPDLVKNTILADLVEDLEKAGLSRKTDGKREAKTLQQELKAINRSAGRAVRKSNEIFCQLLQLNKLRLTLAKESLSPRRDDAELERLAHRRPEPPPAEPEDGRPAPPAEPETRAEFLQRSCPVALDPDTAHPCLLLSEGGRKATSSAEEQPYPGHPDRFTDMHQVLGRGALGGRHYWEVEWGSHGVSVAVAYRDISRSGYGSGFGNDETSWTLECSENLYEFRHNGVVVVISGPQTRRIGVYLDHGAGTLSFYAVSHTMTLLHRVRTTFRGPLYQGLGVFAYENAAEFCELW